MIVYQSTKQGFRDDVFSNEIDKKILEAYKIHLGRSTSANEPYRGKTRCRIWTGSWKILTSQQMPVFPLNFRFP